MVRSGRTGDDRRLNKAIQDISTAASEMSRSESRALTTLLNKIVSSNKDGNLEVVLNRLVSHLEVSSYNYWNYSEINLFSGGTINLPWFTS